MAHIHDSVVVEFIVRFQHGYQDGIFAAFFPAVLIQFLEEICVFMLAGCGLVFIFHLHHDGNVFHSVFIIVTENKISLTATGRDFVVFLEVCILESDGAHLIKRCLTVLLQSLPDHLRGLTGL